MNAHSIDFEIANIHLESLSKQMELDNLGKEIEDFIEGEKGNE